MSRWQVPQALSPFAGLRALADPVAWLEARAVERYRTRPGRSTFRFEHDGRSWFAKIHEGPGGPALLGDLLRLRRPVAGAGDEWRALARLRAAGVPVPEALAWGWCGRNPLRRRSFLVLREIDHEATLEERLRAGTLAAPARRRLLERLAALVRMMHAAGVNHRDLYLVHLLHGADDRIWLIDLHRAQVRRRIPRRWRSKDLAALRFSAELAGPVGLRDRLRFLRAYDQRPLRRLLAEERALLADVERRARRMLRRGARG